MTVIFLEYCRIGRISVINMTEIGFVLMVIYGLANLIILLALGPYAVDNNDFLLVVTIIKFFRTYLNIPGTIITSTLTIIFLLPAVIFWNIFISILFFLCCIGDIFIALFKRRD